MTRRSLPIGHSELPQAPLKARTHADKYRGSGRPIICRVEFSRDARNVVSFQVERA